MSRAKRHIAGALVALAFFTAGDHMMRLDQARLCQIDDALECPARLWWLARDCETDGECALIAGDPL